MNIVYGGILSSNHSSSDIRGRHDYDSWQKIFTLNWATELKLCENLSWERISDFIKSVVGGCVICKIQTVVLNFIRITLPSLGYQFLQLIVLNLTQLW